MLLVPRQLRRAGLTGDVPYYGGRFSPAQAYAVSHPAPPPPPPAAPPVAATAEQVTALQRLRDSDVISLDEYDRLLGRVQQ
jgi:hypothetical protein